MYVYGGNINGSITSELWKYDIFKLEWTRVNSSSLKSPIAVTGHASVLIGTIFGN